MLGLAECAKRLNKIAMIAIKWFTLLRTLVDDIVDIALYVNIFKRSRIVVNMRPLFILLWSRIRNIIIPREKSHGPMGSPGRIPRAPPPGEGVKVHHMGYALFHFSARSRPAILMPFLGHPWAIVKLFLKIPRISTQRSIRRPSWRRACGNQWGVPPL